MITKKKNFKVADFSWNSTIQEISKMTKHEITYCSCSIIEVMVDSNGMKRCIECGLLIKQ